MCVCVCMSLCIVCLSVYLSVSLSVCLSVCLSLFISFQPAASCLAVCIFTYLLASPSTYLAYILLIHHPIGPLVYRPTCQPAVHQPACLPACVCLSISQSAYLSGCMQLVVFLPDLFTCPLVHTPRCPLACQPAY